ncbi:Hpt domain-containing protein, partial [Acinetobacter baumannii]
GQVRNALSGDDWVAAVGGFGTAARREIDHIADALKDGGGVSDFRRPAHTLKGTSANLGARSLALAAARIERATPDQARAEIAGLVSLLNR